MMTKRFQLFSHPLSSPPSSRYSYHTNFAKSIYGFFYYDDHVNIVHCWVNNNCFIFLFEFIAKSSPLPTNRYKTILTQFLHYSQLCQNDQSFSFFSSPHSTYPYHHHPHTSYLRPPISCPNRAGNGVAFQVLLHGSWAKIFFHRPRNFLSLLPRRVPVFSSPRLLPWFSHLSYGAWRFLDEGSRRESFEALHTRRHRAFYLRGWESSFPLEVVFRVSVDVWTRGGRGWAYWEIRVDGILQRTTARGKLLCNTGHSAWRFTWLRGLGLWVGWVEVSLKGEGTYVYI